MKNKTYAGFSEKGKKKAEKLRVLPVAGFASRLFACVLTLFCCASLHAGMSPKHPDISGTTVGAAMAKGDLIYHLSTPGLSCTHEPVTAFSNVYKKLSSDEVSNNIVVPQGGMFAALHVDFIDNDFEVNNGVYTIWEGNDSVYRVTTTGHPFPADLFGADKTAAELASFGISANLSGVPYGRYPTRFTITDKGSPTRTGVTDVDGTSFDFDLWVIDLAEKSGTVSVPAGGTYEIDLTCIPGDFPHEDVCYISVSWGGILPMPGMNTPSNLYTDAACTEAITEDTGSICSKKWLYGDEDTPTKIYYQRPTGAFGQDTVYIRLLVNNTQFIEKYITFKNLSNALVKYIDAPAPDEILWGYWTGGSYLQYPTIEWEDVDEDGKNTDVIGASVTGDKNRPFVFGVGDDFIIDEVAFKAYQNGSVSGNYSVASDLFGYSKSGALPPVDNLGRYILDLSLTAGNTLDKIGADNVMLNWSLAGDDIRTKHRVYTIGGELTELNDFHTLLEISCEAAKGLSPNEKDLIVWRIWNKLRTLCLNRIDGEGPLVYWGPNIKGHELAHNDISELLETLDGNCYAWAKLFRELLKLQGVETTGCIITFDTELFNFNKGEHCLGFLQKPNEVQGGGIRTYQSIQTAFDNHVIVRYVDSANNVWYFDPGTGRAIQGSWQDYVLSEIDLWFFDENDDEEPYPYPVASYDNSIYYFGCQ